ncbi:glycoside hydrolase family 97 protein [Natronoflexus pectinivorans]|uniref:Glycosyl hydrolase family 97 n=1 Tax=Natronoflexus pectinivorans TaxID=682526 RepID=A0A4R2GNI6_9BACT|nr:glycoside hydrolase family 97 protein [Natronoflexus pectinivorans]TCO10640.1 glycosyl hydrolase family 97 [Natronoflexus pectinivorans]
MKQRFLQLFFILLLFSGCKSGEKDLELVSPDGRLKAIVHLSTNGTPLYSLVFDGKIILENSKLGVAMEDADFTENLSFGGISESQVINDQYTLVTGKQVDHVYEGVETVFTFFTSDRAQMDIIFRLSDNGFAYRYYFPGQSDDVKKITSEASSFRFTEGTIGWLSPMSVAKTGWEHTNPSYEEQYEYEVKPGTPSPLGVGWVYPALFKNGDVWMLISEADLHRNYCGTRLIPGDNDNEYKIGFPDPRETIFDGKLNPESKLPWLSPWRLIAVGSLEDIVMSTLGTDLAAPAIDMDFSWVKPGNASWSWIMYKDESVNYNTTREYIDFAADMNWEYCLIDVNWDINIGYDRMKELADYAASKNVELILWYNSAGDWNTAPYTPRSALLTREDRMREFQRISEIGISGVKVDFFGGDGQSVIEYYHDIFMDAAKFNLTVNCHGATLPRGWHRTYPNLVTIEAVEGMEFVTFTQETANNAPRHNTMQVFSRNVFDPIDYTPMNLTGIPGDVKRITTPGHELALPILFTSGIQHLAERPAGIRQVPDYVKDFLRQLPVQWQETRFVDGYPGEFAVLARKAENGWFVAGINGEDKARDFVMNLDLPGVNSPGQLISDGSDKGFSISDVDTDVTLSMEPNGGFVIWYPAN